MLNIWKRLDADEMVAALLDRHLDLELLVKRIKDTEQSDQAEKMKLLADRELNVVTNRLRQIVSTSSVSATLGARAEQIIKPVESKRRRKGAGKGDQRCEDK